MTLQASEWGSGIVDPYPAPTMWAGAAVHYENRELRFDDLKRFASLWIMEGIPYGFRSKPMLYAYLREFISKGLEGPPCLVTVVGSGRLGYSLASGKFPQVFDSTSSDVDCAAISAETFAILSGEFWKWRKLYRSGKIQPSGNKDRFWPSNSEEVPENLKKGFINTNRIPNRDDFPAASQINNMLSSATNELALQGVHVKAVTLRVYRDWPSMLRQVTSSLVAFLRSEKHSDAGRAILQQPS